MTAHFPIEPLIGKPIVVYKDGKRREIGTITSATADAVGIQIGAKITDEDLKQRLLIRSLEGVHIGG